jgi:hypothetical protein
MEGRRETNSVRSNRVRPDSGHDVKKEAAWSLSGKPFPSFFISPPYQLVHPNARKQIAGRKVFFLRKVRECEEIVRTLDALDSLLQEHPATDAEALSKLVSAQSEPVGESAPASDAIPSQYRRKEAVYDEEMFRLLAKVEVASKMAGPLPPGAARQHLHRRRRELPQAGRAPRPDRPPHAR